MKLTVRYESDVLSSYKSTLSTVIFKSTLETIKYLTSTPNTWPPLLRSAVGMTHSLRSDLWWVIPFRYLLGHFGIPFGSHTIKSALARHTGVQVSLVPAKVIMWSLLTNLGFLSPQTYVNQYWHLSYPTYRCTWVVLWLLCFRSAPSTFPDTWSTFKGPFRGVPSH